MSNPTTDELFAYASTLKSVNRGLLPRVHDVIRSDRDRYLQHPHLAGFRVVVEVCHEYDRVMLLEALTRSMPYNVAQIRDMVTTMDEAPIHLALSGSPAQAPLLPSSTQAPSPAADQGHSSGTCSPAKDRTPDSVVAETNSRRATAAIVTEQPPAQKPMATASLADNQPISKEVVASKTVVTITKTPHRSKSSASKAITKKPRRSKSAAAITIAKNQHLGKSIARKYVAHRQRHAKSTARKSHTNKTRRTKSTACKSASSSANESEESSADSGSHKRNAVDSDDSGLEHNTSSQDPDATYVPNGNSESSSASVAPEEAVDVEAPAEHGQVRLEAPAKDGIVELDAPIEVQSKRKETDNTQSHEHNATDGPRPTKRNKTVEASVAKAVSDTPSPAIEVIPDVPGSNIVVNSNAPQPIEEPIPQASGPAKKVKTKKVETDADRVARLGTMLHAAETTINSPGSYKSLPIPFTIHEGCWASMSRGDQIYVLRHLRERIKAESKDGHRLWLSYLFHKGLDALEKAAHGNSVGSPHRLQEWMKSNTQLLILPGDSEYAIEEVYNFPDARWGARGIDFARLVDMCPALAYVRGAPVSKLQNNVGGLRILVEGSKEMLESVPRPPVSTVWLSSTKEFRYIDGKTRDVNGLLIPKVNRFFIRPLQASQPEPTPVVVAPPAPAPAAQSQV